jgi:hypothetical protein
MVGTIPVSGGFTMDALAAALIRNEQNFTQLTALGIDPASGATGNLATFIAQDNQLGALSIVAEGAPAPAQGTKILSTTAYVSSKQTKIDVYRLALG